MHSDLLLSLMTVQSYPTRMIADEPITAVARKINSLHNEAECPLFLALGACQIDKVLEDDVTEQAKLLASRSRHQVC